MKDKRNFADSTRRWDCQDTETQARVANIQKRSKENSADNETRTLVGWLTVKEINKQI